MTDHPRFQVANGGPATARVCQAASLLLILIMVLAVLVQDIIGNADRVGTDPVRFDKRVRLVVVP